MSATTPLRRSPARGSTPSSVTAPVSVITKEFLQDTGITDVNELFLYTVSTEGSGLGGNFSSTTGVSSGFPIQDDSTTA